MRVSVSFLPPVFAAIVFGPLGGLVVGALSNIWDLRESPLRWSVYTPIRALTAATAGAMAWMFFPHPSGWGSICLSASWRQLRIFALTPFWLASPLSCVA